jgi:hypothetical protein
VVHASTASDVRGTAAMWRPTSLLTSFIGRNAGFDNRSSTTLGERKPSP